MINDANEVRFYLQAGNYSTASNVSAFAGQKNNDHKDRRQSQPDLMPGFPTIIILAIDPARSLRFNEAAVFFSLIPNPLSDGYAHIYPVAT